MQLEAHSCTPSRLKHRQGAVAAGRSAVCGGAQGQWPHQQALLYDGPPCLARPHVSLAPHLPFLPLIYPYCPPSILPACHLPFLPSSTLPAPHLPSLPRIYPSCLSCTLPAPHLSSLPVNYPPCPSPTLHASIYPSCLSLQYQVWGPEALFEILLPSYTSFWICSLHCLLSPVSASNVSMLWHGFQPGRHQRSRHI